MATSQATQSEQAPAAIESEGLPDGERLSLAEMTRIMDVAATLRKERALVDEQLNIDQIKARLRERLLEAARVSGDPVTEAEIDAAINQYYDRLHEFQEPPAGFETFLAHAWVRRGPILKFVAAIAAGIVVIWGLLAAGLLPGEARDRRLAVERQEAVAEQFAKVEQTAYIVLQIAVEEDVKREIESLEASARAAKELGDVATLADLTSKLASLKTELESQYLVTIDGRPGQTAIERNWTDEKGTRTSGLYVFVEARDFDGNAVIVPIEDRETGRVEMVSRWGEQIPEDVFQRLQADKEADGVLDERRFGVKRRGNRQIDVQIKSADRVAPLTRQGQYIPRP